MNEEFQYHLNANLELFKKFWWVYLLIFLICTSSILVAYVLRNKYFKQQDSESSVPNRFENPLYYFIGVIVGIIGMVFEYIYPTQSYVESNRHVHIFFYALYSIGGKWAVWLFWFLLTSFFMGLGLKKYQEKGKIYFSPHQDNQL